jgi:CRP-like cAMP-binding protein
MSQYLIDYLRLFRYISNEDLSLITESFQKKHVKQGECLLKAGTVNRQLFFINKGVLKITVPHPKERDIVYFFMADKQFMGFLYSIYGNVPAQQGLQAACDTEVLVIEMENLLELNKKLPYFEGLLDKISQLSMAEMITIKNNYLIGEALDKYKLFLKIEREVAYQVALVDVASYLGIRQQSLSRIRKHYVTIDNGLATS